MEIALMSHSSGSYDNASVSSPAAVCVLFSMKAGEPCVLMIKRGSTLSHHSGEWAFPGGMSEEFDESPMHTALRETNEELGIDPADIDVWCGMAPVETSTGFKVWPFAGRVADQTVFKLQEREVEEVVEIPVKVFVDDRSKRTITLIRNGDTRLISAYAYEDRIIWGASARIISNIFDIVMNSV
tara:strand:- start:147 stop:698 length:552 start_codon:yes stop_codon:yes gene_type:complete